jgi:hypothetical protein
MYFTTAKFNSVCAETGAAIRKGQTMLYDNVNRKCYTTTSTKATNERECISTAQVVAAQENAYFDNFCMANNI